MDKTTLSVPLELNAAGFMSQECPACKRTFKVQPKLSPPVKYCPYCGHAGTNCWLTKQQAEYLGAYGAHQVVLPELDKMFKNLGRNSGGAIKVTKSSRPTPKAPSEPDDAMPSVNFTCCASEVRHDGRTAQLRCPNCGRLPVA